MTNSAPHDTYPASQQSQEVVDVPSSPEQEAAERLHSVIRRGLGLANMLRSRQPDSWASMSSVPAADIGNTLFTTLPPELGIFTHTPDVTVTYHHTGIERPDLRIELRYVRDDRSENEITAGVMELWRSGMATADMPFTYKATIDNRLRWTAAGSDCAPDAKQEEMVRKGTLDSSTVTKLVKNIIRDPESEAGSRSAAHTDAIDLQDPDTAKDVQEILAVQRPDYSVYVPSYMIATNDGCTYRVRIVEDDQDTKVYIETLGRLIETKGSLDYEVLWAATIVAGKRYQGIEFPCENPNLPSESAMNEEELARSLTALERAPRS